MNQKNVLVTIAALLLIGGVVAFRNFSGDKVGASLDSQVRGVTSEGLPEPAANIEPSAGFIEKFSFESDDEDYTLGPIPGHYWKQDSASTLLAEHYNGSEPFAWASDVSADTLLYEVEGTLGSCSNGYLSDKPAENGFVHFHGSNEDSNVGFWLKHTAVTPFVWDGPPGNPDLGRNVPVGVDLKFPNICEFPADAQAGESESSDTLGVSDSAEGVVEVSMTAEQWKFTPSEVRVKEGDTVRMTITSLDVGHGFAINEFGVNEAIPPGETVTFEFVASEKGTFRQYCNILCGVGHAGMVGDFIVE